MKKYKTRKSLSFKHVPASDPKSVSPKLLSLSGRSIPRGDDIVKSLYCKENKKDTSKAENISKKEKALKRKKNPSDDISKISDTDSNTANDMLQTSPKKLKCDTRTSRKRQTQVDSPSKSNVNRKRKQKAEVTDSFDVINESIAATDKNDCLKKARSARISSENTMKTSDNADLTKVEESVSQKSIPIRTRGRKQKTEEASKPPSETRKTRSHKSRPLQAKVTKNQRAKVTQKQRASNKILSKCKQTRSNNARAAKQQAATILISKTNVGTRSSKAEARKDKDNAGVDKVSTDVVEEINSNDFEPDQQKDLTETNTEVPVVLCEENAEVDSIPLSKKIDDGFVKPMPKRKKQVKTAAKRQQTSLQEHTDLIEPREYSNKH